MPRTPYPVPVTTGILKVVTQQLHALATSRCQGFHEGQETGFDIQGRKSGKGYFRLLVRVCQSANISTVETKQASVSMATYISVRLHLPGGERNQCQGLNNTLGRKQHTQGIRTSTIPTLTDEAEPREAKSLHGTTQQIGSRT